jgi:four helix bundle protein
MRRSSLGGSSSRSAASVGANVSEAKGAESRADFIHKYGIAQKEARESLYWLALMLRADLVSAAKLQSLIQETNELIAILTSILVKLKRRK